LAWIREYSSWVFGGRLTSRVSSSSGFIQQSILLGQGKELGVGPQLFVLPWRGAGGEGGSVAVDQEVPAGQVARECVEFPEVGGLHHRYSRRAA